jgi:hypothetical protein
MRRTRRTGPSITLLCACVACTAGIGRCIAAVDAQTGPPEGAAAPDAASLERRLEEHEKRLRQLSELISLEQQQIEADRRALAAYRKSSSEELARATGKGAAPGDQPPPAPVGEAPKPAEAPAATAQIFEEPTALTPRGHFVLEPAVQYVHSTNNQVALVGYTILPALTIGLIDIQRVESNLTNIILTGRYGITSRLELELKAPYIIENTSTETRPLGSASVTNSFFNASGSDIGDAELAMRAQLNHFTGDNPVWLASLRFKSHTGTNVFELPLDSNTELQTKLATGSGFYAVQPGITVLLPSDPAVFFGGAAYTHSFGRDVGFGYGHVNPGGILDLSMGMGLGLNDRASFSVGYQHSIVDQTTQTGSFATGRALVRQGTLQLGTLRFGVSYRMTDHWTLNTTLGVGVTRDSPDLEATIRFPYRF